MSQEPASPGGIVSRIRELLGMASGDAESELSQLSLEALLRLTRRQLLDGARYLGLTGVGRLTKAVLARQFLEVLRTLVPSAEPEAQEDPGDGPRKFDLGHLTDEAAEAERIPWGYGQDRVTTMVVDPERLYVYWEVTDEAIERARAGLGPGGPDAWLNLRVYDVTSRIFDGTNAHAYFDQVGVADRPAMVLLHREAHVHDRASRSASSRRRATSFASHVPGERTSRAWSPPSPAESNGSPFTPGPGRSASLPRTGARLPASTRRPG